jgi:hypothetical protein
LLPTDLLGAPRQHARCRSTGRGRDDRSTLRRAGRAYQASALPTGPGPGLESPNPSRGDCAGLIEFRFGKREGTLEVPRAIAVLAARERQLAERQQRFDFRTAVLQRFGDTAGDIEPRAGLRQATDALLDVPAADQRHRHAWTVPLLLALEGRHVGLVERLEMLGD